MVLNEVQIAIRDTVRGWAQAKVRPHAAQWEDAGAYPAEIFKALAELGLFGMTAPAEWGGAEADYVSYALALMELAAGDGGLSTIVSVHNAPVVAAVLARGSDDQKRRFLPRLCSGELIGAFALTESDAGSDAGAMASRAVRVDGGWRLHGTKQFITSARIAGLTIVFAVTDPAAGKRGITAFLAPAGTPGLVVAKVEHKLGQRASDTCALNLDDAFLDDGLVLGEPGQGYSIALANLEAGRLQPGRQVRQAEAHGLMLDDRLAEGHSFLRVRHRDV